MLIACKFEEIYAPEVRDFVYISDEVSSIFDCLCHLATVDLWKVDLSRHIARMRLYRWREGSCMQ